MALIRGGPIPADRVYVISFDPGASRVHSAESKLTFPVSLPCRALIPAHGFFVVLGNTGTGGIPDSQSVLCACVSLFGSESIPFHCGGQVFGRTGAGDVETCQVELCGHVSGGSPCSERVHGSLTVAHRRPGTHAPEYRCDKKPRAGSLRHALVATGDWRRVDETGALFHCDQLVGIEHVERIDLAAWPENAQRLDASLVAETERHGYFAL